MHAYGWLNVGVLFVYILLQVASMVAIVAFPPSLLLLLPSSPSPLHPPPHKAARQCLAFSETIDSLNGKHIRCMCLLLPFSTIQVQVLDMSLVVTVKILCATFETYKFIQCYLHTAHVCTFILLLFSAFFRYTYICTVGAPNRS